MILETATGLELAASHLIHKATLNYLAKRASFPSLVKLLSVVSLQTKWLWVRVQVQSLQFQISRLFCAKHSLVLR